METERKFLVKNNDWRDIRHESIHIEQFYLAVDPPTVVRARKYISQYYLSIKSRVSNESSLEFDKEISSNEYEGLKKIAKPGLISKMRHHIPYEGMIWHLDEFLDHNKGLLLAEIEFETGAKVLIPSWIGDEVTGNLQYNNAYLASNCIV